MSTSREAQFSHKVLIDPQPMPSDIPAVAEVGSTSAPLKSASFYIGAKCAPYNDDYMLCKSENAGKSEEACLGAGRKVTRCTINVLEALNASCTETFKAHWQCLEMKNHDFKNCRPAERALSHCVFEKMGIKKVVPGTPEGKEPWNAKSPIYRPFREDDVGLALEKKIKAA